MIKLVASKTRELQLVVTEARAWPMAEAFEVILNFTIVYFFFPVRAVFWANIILDLPFTLRPTKVYPGLKLGLGLCTIFF